VPTRCDCHGFLQEDCDRLRGVETKERTEQAEESARWARLFGQRYVFASRYGGVCDRCQEGFPAGAPIKAVGDGRYLGPCCIEEGERASA
jgi:hypothetical protein